MRLQAKFALYNVLTKIAIILSLALLFNFSTEQVAYSHLDARILQKKEQFIKNLSGKEISEYISEQDTDFTSYNIFKEEYILLKTISSGNQKDGTGIFSTESRIIENQTNDYRILTYNFDFERRHYQLEIGESLASIKQFKQTLRTYTLVVLLVAILLTLITDFLFTGFLLKPLAAIINKRLQDVNDPSHFNFEPIATSTSDFKHLDKQLKEMLTSISQSFHTQKEFIGNVSHELLTPISILKSRFENLLNENSISDEVQNKIYASLNTLYQLKNIVNSLLLISKIENEQFKPNESIVVNKLIQEISEELKDRLDDKSLHFNADLKYNYHFIGSKSLIRTMLFNVITNAIKYNAEQGTITISDSIVDEKYQLSIADTGKGIDEERLPYIFDRFEKLNTNEEESHGLGLAIVKSIANFHKIDINVYSQINKGTRITFTFPRL
ncbi:sensor histidine kinase [Solitalea lacus]|uniref:sensor histidine kinase n=1 Tax=Solitalea lacus TaxID=2911172 RepID=UPI001ED9C83F|nr:HAMP domain-containing sensor histidine kinase [Solitalea lacus]UKJ08833.1 HAMP domain-containing histidine kinase [Solitalea lacus]